MATSYSTRWLVRYAGQNQRRDTARAFVAATTDQRVYGYYPRLAVDAGQQGHGIGAALLSDSLTRVVRAAEQVAVHAVVVHAVDESAASFYARYGFRALSETPRTLVATLAMLQAAGDQ